MPKTLKPAEKRARKVTYSEEVAQTILDRLSAGERWRRIAGTDGMPSEATLFLWRDRYPEFAKAYRLAKQAGADARADAVLDVAEAATPATVSVARAHIGALKWHVDRDDRIWRREEPDLGEGRVLVVRFRHFERYVADDGVTRVREVPLPPHDGAAAEEGAGE
ncbi:hypothetical protein [Phenylobacterium sp.]|jgi:hypothetical protein|uniref:terminase small subunit-like protein n=1 Tax=Phenylobacterium sp. TaxID=1871053 RepID=UPI002F958026